MGGEVEGAAEEKAVENLESTMTADLKN